MSTFAATAGAASPAADSLLRFNLAMQRSRAGVMVTAMLIGLALRWSGKLSFSYGAFLAINAAFLFSCLLFYKLYEHGFDRRWGRSLTLAWFGCDVIFSTWAVYVSEDLEGLWLIWFLVNVAAAAFVAGGRFAAAVALANSVAYVLLLTYLGLITGFDRTLVEALLRLAVVYGAGFGFLRGISSLREKRRRIRELMEENRREVNELRDLHRELALRSQALAQANERIREADRLKSQFLANMSHELRTPLNSIIGFSEILVEKLEGKTEPRYHKFLNNILTSGRHLLGLINDILDLSKIEAGKMELAMDRVSLSAIVSGVEGIMRGVADPRHIVLRADVPASLPPVVADGPKLKQVLYNLVSNAIKFSPDGGEVTVAVRLHQAAQSPLGERTVEISVRDHGKGIAPPDHEGIFEAFHQTEGGASRVHGGTGLGLTIVRSFVELHGGRVIVESALGEGSTFRVFLPTGDRAPATQPLTVMPALGPVVLVVEDDDTFYEALAQDLVAEGYRPRRARHGDEVLRLAKEFRPALVTLDLVLPGLDGWEVLKAIKNDPETSGIPVVVVSMVANHELGLALGADDYFLKPLQRGDFLERLRVLAPAAAVVLLIDDDPQIHDLIGMDLQEAGYRVISAASGAEGLRMAAELQPALVVLDLMMPGLGGFEVAAELRRDTRTQAIPIVILTAKELTAEDRTRLGGNIAAALSKAPEQRRSLRATVRQALARRSGREV
jgi:signal transduction histidine kinase/DNA-binding response OmpR family regulator